MDFGDTCALVCRLLLMLMLLGGVVLSSMVVASCRFISAITHNDEAHGVGLQTFEAVSGKCVPHNSFVIENYNGMEMAAKVGGYVAPTCASVALLWLVLECCMRDGCWGGKCIPVLLVLGALICQGVTFMLFQSDLFCSNKDIARCDVGGAGYNSIYAMFVYAFCLVLYYCGPAPVPCARRLRTQPEPKRRRRRRSSSQSSSSSDDSKHSKKKKKKKKPQKTEPGKDEDWTKEMYEARRRERNVKGRGVSGRKKEEIFDDLDKKGDSRGRGRKEEREHETSLAVYEHKRKDGPEPKFDDYVDTEPDGMDWSAYTPDQREAYYERQRSKKRERKERERRQRRQREEEEDRSREWERGPGDRNGGRRAREDEEYSAAYSAADYDDSYRRRESVESAGADTFDQDTYDQNTYDQNTYDESYRSDYYSERGGGGYELTRYKDYGNGRGGARNGRGGDRRGDRGGRDDYSYAQDSYSYAQDYSTGDPPTEGESYRGSRPSRRDESDRYDDSYYDESYASYDDRRGGRRDDPSFV